MALSNNNTNNDNQERAVSKVINQYVSTVEKHNGKAEGITIHDLIINSIKSDPRLQITDEIHDEITLTVVAPNYHVESELQQYRNNQMIQNLGKIASVEHPALFVDLTGCGVNVENPMVCINNKGLRLSADDYAVETMKYKHPELLIVLYREYDAYDRFVSFIDKNKLGRSWKSANHLAYSRLIVCEQPGTFEFTNDEKDAIHTYKAALFIRNNKVDLKKRG